MIIMLQNEHSEKVNPSKLERDIRCLQRENDELKLMYDTVVKHATSLENDLERRMREVTYLSVTDSLTGVYNRRKFNQCLVYEVDSARAQDRELSLIIYDVDIFKKINDTYGHDYGDFILLTITNIVRETITGADIIARWGGDEFTILMPGKSLEKAAAAAEEIRKKIYGVYFDAAETISCSFGVSSLKTADDFKSFVVRADMALYEAKNSGRNCVKSLE